jgi:endonuclease I
MRISGRKASPPSYVRGDIASIYMHMNTKYPGLGIVGNKRKRIFKKWLKEDPISKEECVRFKKIKQISNIKSEYLSKLCTMSTDSTHDFEHSALQQLILPE